MTPCPIPKCPASIPRNHVMCVEHWRVVPQPMRSDVNRTFRDFKRRGFSAAPAWRHARAQAIDEVVRRLNSEDLWLPKTPKAPKSLEF